MEQTDPDEGAIFSAAKELADARQVRAYLDKACAGNPELRRRVERLLGLADEAKGFFELHAIPGIEPPELFGLKTTVSTSVADPLEGTLPRLGDYQLLEEIARGGWGSFIKHARLVWAVVKGCYR